MAMQITGLGDSGALIQTRSITADPSRDGDKGRAKADAGAATAGGQGAAKAQASQNDPKVQAQIQELVQIQNKVIAHEQAHMAAGGGLAGGATYSYTVGPDGKRYITGGEVSINTLATDDPNEKIRLMGRVIAAAMAPADPSPQDRRVAASAAAQQSQAYMELARLKAEEAYGKGVATKPAGNDATGAAKAQGRETPGGSLDMSI